MKEASAVVLSLPDGRIVFQRRDNHALFSPEELGFFGGGREPGETALQTAVRELGEEISEYIPNDKIKLIFNEEHRVKTSKGSYDILAHVFTAPVHHEHLKVYEGKGAEVYTLNEALERNDLAEMTRYILERIKNGTSNN